MNSDEKQSLISKFFIIALLLIIITALITYNFTLRACIKEGIVSKEGYSEDSSQNINALGITLKNFRRVIDKYYLGEIDEEKMFDETLKGYINGLGDEYSEYMTKDEWDEFQEQAFGNFVGIGVYMGQDKAGNTLILQVIENTPAEKAGLQAEDIIAEVDGESVMGLSTDEVANKVKGEEGTIVKVKILRNNEYLDFDIERKQIKAFPTTGKMLENNIGYIELETFDEDCSEDFINKFNELKNQGANKLIIDLRYNTGGLVDEALTIADYLLDKDSTMLITRDSEGNEEITKAQNDKKIDMDIVVLVNEYSASASEILAGALKDNGEAKLVGEKTYGKGVIQNVFTLADGSVLKLTVNEYLTPNKTTINKIGIEPDFEVKIDTNNKDEKGVIIDSQLEKAKELLK